MSAPATAIDPTGIECPHGRMTIDGEPCLDCGPSELLAGLRDGDWLNRQVFPPLRWHLHGIVPEGYTLLVGPPKVGKSWMVLTLLLGCAYGGRVLGLEVDQRPVLYLALEDGDRRMQDRCRKLLEGSPIPTAFSYLTRLEPGTLLETVTQWLDQQPDDEPLVVVDTLGRVKPAALVGESAYQHDYRVGAALKRLVDERPGAGLVVVHHDRKAESSDFVDRVSGTNGLAGSADTIVVLARARQEHTGLLSVTGRDVPECEYAVEFDAQGHWTLAGGTLDRAARAAGEVRATDGLDQLARSVIEHVGRHPEGVRFGDVKDAMGESAARYLSRLVDGGRLVKLQRGVYASVPTTNPLSEVSARTTENGQTDGSDTPTDDEQEMF